MFQPKVILIQLTLQDVRKSLWYNLWYRFLFMGYRLFFRFLEVR